MPVSVVFAVLQVVSLLASVLTSFRLWKSGLVARYPVLALYLVFMVPYMGGPLMLNLHSRAYYYWILQILLVRELCGTVLAKHRGICTLGRWVMYGGMLVSVGISLLGLLPRIQSPMTARSRTLALLTAGNRSVNLALAVFLILMLFLVTRYPVRLSRNVMLNTVVFSVFFLSNTFGAIMHTLFDRQLGLTMDTALTALSTICSLAWLVLLTPAGEETGDWLHFSPDYEKRVLGKLDLLNRVLLGQTL
jgi:hypothetical protein